MRCAALSSITTALLLTAAPLVAQHPSRGPSIPQVAKTAGQFTTLLAAVDAAGLTETLLGRGPFTVFAPTDEAFARLPNGTVQELLKPENREKLRTILTYHLVAGRVTAQQARGVNSAETVAGQSVRVSTSGDQLRINDATVRIADIPASNGLIHVIDRVLLPSETRSSDARGGKNGSAVDVVDLAIQRGVPLFNNGQAESTVAIYEVATRALLSLGTDLPEPARRALRTALGDTSGSVRDRAFTLRGGLDEARRSLTGQMEMGSTR
jgi:transforming growth factor-beta-induced protein